MDRVIGVWHHFAPRDGYTKFSLTMVWAATPLIFSVWEVVLPGQQTFLFSRSYVALHKKFKNVWGVSP